MILYNFSTFIQPLKPVMFIFPMLILYKVIEVSIFQTIIYVFEMLIKEPSFRNYVSVKTSLNLHQS